MRDHRLLRILLLPSLATVLAASALAGSAASAPHGPALPRSVLVGFRPNVSLAGQADVLADAGVERLRRYPQIRSALVSVGAQSTAGAIRDLDSDPRVAFAEPNFTVRASDVTPNDPFLPRLWGLDNTGQTVNWTTGTADADIDAKEAWSVSTGSPNVVVAVIDTGVDVTHPDLAQNIWVNPGEDCAGCRTNGVDDDGNGYVDDWRGWDFVNGDNNPTDDNGHGTHVAGTIAAAGNNGLGVTGVTWSSKIMPLKFLAADGTGTAADAISAILYARAKGVPILSNSWGGDEFSQAMLAAIQQTDESGELFVAAAGNDFTNTDTAPNYPSGYDVAQRPRGRRDRPVRPQGLVLELRRAERRPGRARDERLLDLARRHVPLRGRDVDGDAARVRGCRAGKGRVPERDRRGTEGAPAAHGRPARVAGRNEQDRGQAQRRPRGSVLVDAAGVDRVAGGRKRGQRGAAAADQHPRCRLRLADWR